MWKCEFEIDDQTGPFKAFDKLHWYMFWNCYTFFGLKSSRFSRFFYKVDNFKSSHFF